MKGEHERANRLPVDESRDQLMVKVTRMAYHMDKTQTEIAAETGLTRWQVRRLLQEAKDSGIVRIEIVPPNQRVPDLEAAVAQSYGLRDAAIVRGGPDKDQLVETVAKAAGDYLAALKPAPSIMGVSWGRTMSSVAHWLPQNWTEDVTVVQINGTVMLNVVTGRTNDVAQIFAFKGQGQSVPLPVPAIVGEALTRDVLERDRIVSNALTQARSAQVHVFSFGVASEESVLLSSGNILPEEMEKLIDMGAVGDVLGRFIDRNGKIVDSDVDARTVGLTFDDIKGADWIVGVASGAEKHAVVKAVLRAKLINVLITDDETAHDLMGESDED